jgi:hypothetical protein
MLYNLPNGKTIYLTVEEFLNLTDADIQYLVSMNYGDTITNPFSGSPINKKTRDVEYDFSDYHNDDEPENDIEIDLNNLEDM